MYGPTASSARGGVKRSMSTLGGARTTRSWRPSRPCICLSGRGPQARATYPWPPLSRTVLGKGACGGALQVVLCCLCGCPVLHADQAMGLCDSWHCDACVVGGRRYVSTAAASAACLPLQSLGVRLEDDTTNPQFPHAISVWWRETQVSRVAVTVVWHASLLSVGSLLP